MTLSCTRIGMFLVALCGGVTAAQASVVGETTPFAPSPNATWTLASHKPLMQSTLSPQTTPPTQEASAASDVGAEGEDMRRVTTQQAYEANADDLVSETVDAPALQVTPAPALEPGLELALTPTDGRVSQAVRRYAERHGWQLAWEIERDFPIEYPATFRGDFLGIVEQIVHSLQSTDAPIRVKVYAANRVLRVVHATQ
ncbi:toxin co-regulated pilus biosynthesis Q family protein [Pandoraea pnomenusa]|uniref:toxin co-regulated pilus biosynthesis Q family protein n=1 Tax=Pandoraea pnomenusa TaxID=93220 RepID=UPI0033417378